MRDQAPQQSPRILLVEDDPSFGPLIERMLTEDGYRPQLAPSAEHALEALGDQRFDLAICDINLPGGSGLDLLIEFDARRIDLPVIIASGVSDPATSRQANVHGAYGYLVKPFEREQLLITVRNALHRHELELQHRAHSDLLERTVEERTVELREAVAELTSSRRETITRLTRALEMRDGDTGAHVERIGELARRLALWAGVDHPRAQIIGLAAPMHDIGKIGIPDRVLLKAGALEPEERGEIERHCEIGREILAGSGIELLELAASIAATHHEWFDGSGYPAGLAGEKIPIEGRIVAIVDVFDALHSDRCYRPAYGPEQALELMRSERGTHFDPELFDVFIDHHDEALAILGCAGEGSPGGPSAARQPLRSSP